MLLQYSLRSRADHSSRTGGRDRAKVGRLELDRFARYPRPLAIDENRRREGERNTKGSIVPDHRADERRAMRGEAASYKCYTTFSSKDNNIFLRWRDLRYTYEYDMNVWIYLYTCARVCVCVSVCCVRMCGRHARTSADLVRGR